jgi:hypothetical protein
MASYTIVRHIILNNTSATTAINYKHTVDLDYVCDAGVDVVIRSPMHHASLVFRNFSDTITILTISSYNVMEFKTMPANLKIFRIISHNTYNHSAGKFDFISILPRSIETIELPIVTNHAYYNNETEDFQYMLKLNRDRLINLKTVRMFGLLDYYVPMCLMIDWLPLSMRTINLDGCPKCNIISPRNEISIVVNRGDPILLSPIAKNQNICYLRIITISIYNIVGTRESCESSRDYTLFGCWPSMSIL